MDTNSGEFVGLDRAEQWMKRIEVGQNVKILGEEFEVLGFKGRTMVVKLLSYGERLGIDALASAAPDLAGILAAVEAADPQDATAAETARHRKRMLDGKG